MITMRILAPAPIALCAFLTIFAASPASAVSMDKSARVKECSAAFGTDSIHVAAYQPEVSLEKYCDALPSTGRTILAFDLDAPGLRNIPIEIRIVKEPMVSFIESGAGLQSEAYLAPQIYPNGTVSFEHDFKDGGQFLALVTAVRPNGEKTTAQFKFSVGQTFRYWMLLILGGAVIAAVMIVQLKFGRKRSTSAAAERDLAA